MNSFNAFFLLTIPEQENAKKQQTLIKKKKDNLSIQ